MSYPLPLSALTLPGLSLIDATTDFSSLPTFVPSSGVKRWADPSRAGLPAAGTVTYQVFDNFRGIQVPLVLANAVAAAFNVPQIFSHYAVDPTDAQISIARGTATPLVLPLSAYMLSTAEQAAELAAEIGPALGLQLQVSVSSQVIEANGETRQQFILISGPIMANVGQLLATKNFNGVGSPGSWTLTNGQIGWNGLPVPQPGPATPPDIAIPQRALLATEKFQPAGPIPGAWQVVSVAAADSTSPATAAAVAQLQSDMNAVKAVLGIRQ